MKTIKKQIEEIIDRPINGHPITYLENMGQHHPTILFMYYRENQIKIKKLEDIVIKLAQQIDILIDMQR